MIVASQYMIVASQYMIVASQYNRGMAVDLGKLKELRGAVAAAPAEVSLRIELIQMLLEAQRPQEAWHHCIRILNHQPDHVAALEWAREAALTVGAVERAQDYEAQLTALGAMPAERPGEKTFHVRGRTLRLIRGAGGQDEE